MESKKKKTIIISSLIAVILVIIVILLTIKLINIKRNSNTNETANQNIMEENIESNIENKIEINVIEKESNNIEVNENNENNEYIYNEEQAVQIADPKQEVDKQTIQAIQNKQEKAIEIAKKHYGEKDSVYFTYEGIEDKKHKVFVRDANTTRTIIEYYIDIENETFEILQ